MFRYRSAVQGTVALCLGADPVLRLAQFMFLTSFMNLKIKSLFSALIPLHISAAESASCAVQNCITSLLKIHYDKLYGSFVSDYHNNVSLLQFL
jgi:hypothetical protein